jgi:hypothetical protein
MSNLLSRSSLRGAPCTWKQVSSDAAVVTRLDTGESRVVTLGAAKLLDQLLVFQPPSEKVAGELAELRRLGLLLYEPPAPGISTPPTRIATVAVITKQDESRWPVLERCLRSIADNVQAHRGAASGVRILVCDDAPSPEVRADVRCRIRELARGYAGLEWEYLGREEKQSLEASRFLLFGDGPDLGITTGANRNCALLAARGEPLLMVDDDIIIRLHALDPHGEASYEIHSQDNFHEEVVYRSRTAIPSIPEIEIDLLGAMGSAFGPVVRERIDWKASRASHETYAKVAAGQLPAAIALVQTGLLGDSGTGSPVPTLMALAGNLEPEQDLIELALSRAVLRLNRRNVWSFADTASFMTYCAAVDGRGDIPWFSPRGRGQDGTFATWLRRIRPEAFVALAPFAVEHDPTPDRRFKKEELVTPAGFGLNEMVSNIVQSASLDDPDPRLRSRRIGQLMTDYASRDEREFTEALRHIRTSAVTQYIQRLEGQTKASASAPPHWTRAMEKLIRELEKSLTGPTFGLVWAGPRPCEAAELQAYLRELGSAAMHPPNC